jgi:putative ATP-binding cassette transporter
MYLLELFKKESDGIPRDVYIAGVVSGLANAGVLAAINVSATSVREGGIDYQHLLIFLVVTCIYLYCLRYAFYTVSQIIETTIHRVRVRMVNKIRKTEQVTVEQIGRGQLYSTLTQEALTISQAQNLMVASFQAAAMVAFTTIYMAFLSVAAFFAVTILFTLGAYYYLIKQKETREYLETTLVKSGEFVDGVSQVLDGFKEVRLNTRRSESLNRDVAAVSDEVREATVNTARVHNYLYLFSQSFSYFVIAVVVFLLPNFIDAHAESISELTAAILFIVGPVGIVVNAFPVIAKANFSAKAIQKMEEMLDQHIAETGGKVAHFSEGYTSFSKIEFKGISYAYSDVTGKTLFRVGPLDLTLQRGEVLFVVGGNGSGKSTFMKLLTALYPPDTGGIYLDGEEVTAYNKQDYRELFATIFSDFFLFRKLYGFEDVPARDVSDLLKKMELDQKTRLEGDHFSDINLSTGQRKRLAMVIATLEDRPIYMFDEWAADQDPEFREHFYKDILAEMKAKGRTVIAVSHDDRYYHMADRVLQMDFGQVVRIVPGKDWKLQPRTNNQPKA